MVLKTLKNFTSEIFFFHPKKNVCLANGQKHFRVPIPAEIGPGTFVNTHCAVGIYMENLARALA